MEDLNKEKILEIISKNKSYLEEKFGVKNLYLFGSYVRDEQNEESDIDFIVDFKNKSRAGVILSLNIYLEKLFDKEIDLAERHEIRDDYKEYILNDDLLKC